MFVFYVKGDTYGLVFALRVARNARKIFTFQGSFVNTHRCKRPYFLVKAFLQIVDKLWACVNLTCTMYMYIVKKSCVVKAAIEKLLDITTVSWQTHMWMQITAWMYSIVYFISHYSFPSHLLLRTRTKVLEILGINNWWCGILKINWNNDTKDLLLVLRCSFNAAF